MRRYLLCSTALSCLALLLCANVLLAATPSPPPNAYATAKQYYEQDWQSKIERALQYVPGAIVTVNVELSPEISRSISSNSHEEPITAARTQREVTEENDGKTRTETETKEKSNPSGTKCEKVKVAGLIPQTVKVDISIPEGYCRAVLHSRLETLEESPSALQEQEFLRNVREETRSFVGESVGALIPTSCRDRISGNVVIVFYPDVSPPK